MESGVRRAFKDDLSALPKIDTLYQNKKMSDI